MFFGSLVFSKKIPFLLFFFMVANVSYADSENHGGDIDLETLNQETLFVSLGSYCAPASLARSCGVRKAAFPFDWNISMDGEKLIELLEDDFLHFLSDQYLSTYGEATLLNTYYRIEFVHDGARWDINYFSNMQNLKLKYQRRIERFRNLANYKGKVFFMRAAYIYSDTDPHRAYKLKENLNISEEYSLRLCDSLKKRFPDLNFSLIIINNSDIDHVEEEKKLSDNILMVRAPALNEPLMINAYKVFFDKLLQE